MALIFKIGISRNANCDNMVSFPKSGHIIIKPVAYMFICIDCIHSYIDRYVINGF